MSARDALGYAGHLKMIVFSDDGNSISHNNGNEKMEIKATWRAPNSFSGSIVFKYTVVMNYSEEPYYGVA